MTGWTELLATATLGTDRRPDAEPDELLAAAAAHGLFRRAGRAPAIGLPAPPAAAPERLPVVPAVAANRLAGLLEGAAEGGADRPDLLLEWLELAAAGGWRVPAELLPPLLHAGRKAPHLRASLLAVGGERIAWLAARREEWRFLPASGDAGAPGDVGPPGDAGASGDADTAADARGEGARGGDDPRWSEGTLGQRVDYLAAARQRDPDAAREVLASHWSSGSAEERAKLLDTFEHGLGPGDEEFIESALDDRSKRVREVAAFLLARLPTSRYAARMAERARACVQIDRGQVTVVPPSECDSGMRRDGITAQPPAGGQGLAGGASPVGRQRPAGHQNPTGIEERAWWLSELIARTPLSTWDLSLAAATVDRTWADAVRDGLTRAAAAQQDAAWAAALLDRLVASSRTQPRRIDRQWAEALSTALPPEQLYPRAERLLRGEPAGMVWVDQLLKRCPRPWPVPFGEVVMDGIGALAGSRNAFVLDHLCRTAGLRLAPGLADRAAQLAHAYAHTEDDGGWALARLAKTLRFRTEMTEELT